MLGVDNLTKLRNIGRHFSEVQS